MKKPERDISSERRGRRILNRFVPGNQNTDINKEIKEIIKAEVITNKHPIMELYKKNNLDYIMEKNNTDIAKYWKHLSIINENNIDNSLPFFINISTINYNDLSNLAEEKNKELFKCFDGLTVDKCIDEYDLVTIIPFRGRYMHLEKTLETLLASSNNSPKRIGFIIIENSNESIFNCDKFNNPDIHYRWINSSGNIFNKCFCHNIGSLISNTKYLHFHDCDLLVPSNFYEEVFNKIELNDVVQCFYNRRVNYLNEIPSIDYFNGEDIESIIVNKQSYKEGGYGAPGGSIAISKDLFEKCGGFDPHFFWGYSIEDAFFWNKVERFKTIITLDDPKIELYHLWHHPAWGKNPMQGVEKRIHDSFISNNHNWLDYVNKSKELYNRIKNTFINE